MDPSKMDYVVYNWGVNTPFDNDEDSDSMEATIVVGVTLNGSAIYKSDFSELGETSGLQV